MNQKYEKLISLLKELFQLDQPDLDFGLYRVMHAKSAEVSQFLENDLLPQVRVVFDQYKNADKVEIEKDLATAINQAKALGVDPETTQKVKDLRAKLKSDAVDTGALESEVYDHLFGFFRRYYSEGDFLAKRVYKPGVYAIPYEGEEVTLHWANKDQYYIKTSEYLRDYAFRLRPDDENNPMRVHFCLVNVAEGEHSDVKTAEEKDRVFVLVSKGVLGHDFIAEENCEQSKELVIRFEYRPATLSDWPENERDGKKKPPIQNDLCVLATRRILATTSAALAEWVKALGRLDPTEKEPNRTLLQKHIKRFSDVNTFDYFIHKDLETFLRRELDFYIKNEVLHLDDVEKESIPRVEQYLSKIKVIRKIAGKIIEFLAQIEDFQKKLWLKKKFVVETQYCITVGNIPEEFHTEIAENDAQQKEWLKLYEIDMFKSDLTTPDYSNKLKLEFLKAHPTLVVDTRHFGTDFTARLLEAMDDVDELIDGVLLHSENGQAISLMQTMYQNQIECIHIDPPYNTDTSGFLYPNSYRHSSWVSMMAERLNTLKTLMRENGSLLCHIDENEYERLFLLCEQLNLPNAGTMIWDKRNPMLGRKGLATQHEYVLWRNGSQDSVFLRNANQRRILSKAQELIEASGGVTDEIRKAFSSWISNCKTLSGGEKAYKHLDDEGRVYRPLSMSAGTPSSDPRYFIPLIHPVTKKPCPVPPTGWSRPPETFDKLQEDGFIIFGRDHTTLPQLKRILTQDSRRQVSTVIQDTGRGKTDIHNLGLEFPYCHPLSLYVELLGAASKANDSLVLDVFAGSGTNGHAVIALNREEGTQRKFILVEVGTHFDTVLIPRIKKATYTPEWKKGKPKRLTTSKEAQRSPRIVKVVRLESYEDTVNNLEIRRTEKQQLLLDTPEAHGTDGLREQYILRYMLDIETRGSQSLLNLKSFSNPTAYKLKVKLPGSDESREVNVDLLETFNWLIGLTVRHIGAPQAFNAAFERDSEKRLHLKGRLAQEGNGRYWFRTVTGTTPDGRRTLVIWRKLSDEQEQDNLVLDAWFTRQGYSSRDSEFDLIYVNGGNNLENLKSSDDLWKVRLIEEDFHRLMFEVEGE